MPCFFFRIAGLQLSITDRSSVVDVRQRNVKFMFIGVVDGSEISQISQTRGGPTFTFTMDSDKETSFNSLINSHDCAIRCLS